MTAMPPKLTLVTKGQLHLSVLPQVWAEVRDLIGSIEPGVRPRDCADGASPCPWRECPYAVDNAAHPEVTCAIDVTEDRDKRDENGGRDDNGMLPQTYVATALGISQPRVVALEQKAIRKIRLHPDGPKLLAALRGL